MVFSDYSIRMIPLWMFLLLLFVTYILISMNRLEFFMYDFLANLFFCLFLFLIISLYSIWKSKGNMSSIFKFIGLGDIIMFILITPYFKFTDFIFFMNICFAFSLATYLIFKDFSKSKTIPLAGNIAFGLIVYLIFYKEIWRYGI